MTVHEALRNFQIAIKLMMVFVFAFVVGASFWVFAGCEAMIRPASEDKFADEIRACFDQDASSRVERECLAKVKQQRRAGRR